jgi:hypothetical protein
MKAIKFITVFFLVGVLFSCQKESVEILQDDTTQNITAASPLGSLLSRVSQSPTSNDNILDNTNCFRVQLPVTVIVNTKQIVVATEADYQLVKDAINEASNDDDIVNFVFPITIKYKDFKTRVIENAQKLHDAIEDCHDDDDDDDLDEIECIKIKYPITFNIYNANNQIATTITINNNEALFNFIKNLATNVLIAVNYPISITNPAGQVIVINNNAALESIIENAIKDCHHGGGGNISPLGAILTSGNWKVSYAVNDNQENTTIYSGYNFTFNANGTVAAVKETNTFNGTWSSALDGSEVKLKLAFSAATFSGLNESWKVIEFTTTKIRLRHGSNGGGRSDYLYFTKN